MQKVQTHTDSLGRQQHVMEFEGQCRRDWHGGAPGDKGGPDYNSERPRDPLRTPNIMCECVRERREEKRRRGISGCQSTYTSH